ncbi:hypothetical protein F511_35631 [Dorcoceras hygrometricum]|uniref:Uncharacterized protein n=1 Tax=Dorcoceras hygrometricum TaxID=472368 RepID=A0A2Z7CJS1_9LAMI|nr:hypothetical protein F511_35631 [Dorcoceras hygrometricum]
MRSVVASHGPGSNPRGNAICNAILLQSFPVLQIFGLQYLDRHRPPSSDVLPLNLAQKLKISNRPKTGLISHTGPKTSRAARDRPETTLERNQPSRHRRSGGQPTVATRKSRAPQGRTRPRQARRHRATSGREVAQRVQPASHSHRPQLTAAAPSVVHHRPGCATSCADNLQPASPSSRAAALHQRSNNGAKQRSQWSATVQRFAQGCTA